MTGGYLLEVIAPDDPAVHAAIERFAAAELGAAPVEGSQLGRSQFRLAADGPSLSAVFRALESVKGRLQVRTVSLPIAHGSARHMGAGGGSARHTLAQVYPHTHRSHSLI